MNNCTVNMINFVRGSEPRWYMDLLTPVREQIKLNQKYDIKNTFLLQYDAMIQPCFKELLLTVKDEITEFGVWIELARPLVEKLGIKWNGREGYDWDYHVNPGFLMAYSTGQRELIIDEIMNQFHNTFGYYPKSVGSWLIDCYSMAYMEEKYNIDAFAICRDQYGTDGYTLWGGYFNQGYYPSIHNMMSPAQTLENQINVPTFRMLGFDQLHGYDDHNYFEIGCMTMEPVWPCGQDSNYVEWYMKNQIENEDLGFSYVQVGQENSFGWEFYGGGLKMQMDILKRLEAEGKVVFEQLGETGRRFKKTYKQTPATVVSAYGDFRGNDDSSVWYNCKNYRISLMSEEKKVYIRDIHLFDEEYAERFERKKCLGSKCTYDTLPVVDGYIWDKKDHRGGLYFDCDAKLVGHSKFGDGIKAVVECENGNIITAEMTENYVMLKSDKAFSLTLKTDKITKLPITLCEDNKIKYSYNGYNYSVLISDGVIEKANEITLKSGSENCISIKISREIYSGNRGLLNPLCE